MKLRKENILIRSAETNDAEKIVSWWNDDNVMAHAGYPLGLDISVEDVRKIIRKNGKRLSQFCIIEFNDQSIGECNFNLEADVAEIGIKLCESEYRNKGLGTEILVMLIEYIFSDQKVNSAGEINKIILDTNASNKRAQHVYEKLGFSKVRTNVDVCKNQLGELQTLIDYEMTREYYIEQMKL